MLAEINNFTADEYEQYQKSLDNMGDYQNIINTAVEEAAAFVGISVDCLNTAEN